MLIGRVIGEVVATCKHPSHDERKALLIQGVDLEGNDMGPSFVALDAVEAGVGDKVLVTKEGFSSFSSVGRGVSPIDSAVIGVIDSVDLLAGS